MVESLKHNAKLLKFYQDGCEGGKKSKEIQEERRQNMVQEALDYADSVGGTKMDAIRKYSQLKEEGTKNDPKVIKESERGKRLNDFRKNGGGIDAVCEWSGLKCEKNEIPPEITKADFKGRTFQVPIIKTK